MAFSLRVAKNEAGTGLRRLNSRLVDLRPALEAGGLQIVSIAQRAFRDASLRAAPWAPKADGSPATLIKSGTLIRSIRIVEVTRTSVRVGTDRVYAAIQQFGGVIVPKNKKVLVFSIGGRKVFAKRVKLPPRPFFPITPDGKPTSLAQRKVLEAIKAALS